MTALLYFLVAVVAVSLSTQAFLADRNDPARQAYLALGGAVALAYVGFSLSLLPGLGGFRAVYLFAGCWVPATTLWTIERALARTDRPLPSSRAVYVGTVFVAPVASIAHLVLSDDPHRTTLPAVLAALFCMFGFSAAFRHLWLAQESASLRVDRTRLRYLMGLVAAAATLTMLEQAARVTGPVVDPATLSLSARGVALQGLLPPFSPIFTGLSLYFLYHSVVMSRLLDLTELLSRIATILLSAGALVLIDGVTFAWVDTFTVYPFHSTFQLFLASLLFLAAYDPLRTQISWLADRAFNRRGHQLFDVLDQLRRQLPTIIDADTLAKTLLDGLHSSGRVPVCSIYLWDPHHDAFVCHASRTDNERPLAVVAAQPFTDRFSRGAPWYLRPTVTRRAQHDPHQAEVLALMDAMHADVTLPLASGGTVLGWFHVRDEGWSDGYSAEEILQLQEVAGRASTVLANIREFRVIEEQKRLAALGAMAAGLAHEIRNPLAGVKGAAQFLQSEHLDDDASEMLQVILDETDRLNVVVTQFLDYARPFQLDLRTAHVNAVVAHTLALLRAQGVPDSVTIVQDLSGELQASRFDATRIGQVVLNLVQNGVQAMPAGGTLTVATRMSRLHDGVEISVADTGAGVDPEALDKLFVPFFTTKHAGTGLGLAICRRIVDVHDGDLEVHSVAGSGATFVVRLPPPVVQP